MNEPIIETERAILVCMEPSHIDPMMRLFSTEKNEALKWINYNVTLQKNKGFSTFNVFDKKSGKYIGYCGCREIKLKDNIEVELIWGIYKEYKEDDIDVEVLFAVRNYMFKHFNITSLYSIISMKDPQYMNIVEAIDMEVEYTFFEGFHKFYVYGVNRSSEKFKASFGDGESGARLTSALKRDEYAPSFIRNLRRPRPRPR
jgi:RimJ/RimL family protein N-acetyltransferase